MVQNGGGMSQIAQGQSRATNHISVMSRYSLTYISISTKLNHFRYNLRPINNCQNLSAQLMLVSIISIYSWQQIPKDWYLIGQCMYATCLLEKSSFPTLPTIGGMLSFRSTFQHVIAIVYHTIYASLLMVHSCIHSSHQTLLWPSIGKVLVTCVARISDHAMYLGVYT